MPPRKNKDSHKRSVVVNVLQYIRIFLVITVFLLGSVSIVFTQACFALIFSRNYNVKKAVSNLTKNHFVVLLVTIAHYVCPMTIRITSDSKSLPKGSFQSVGHQLLSALKPSNVIIANHQIYTDWLFIWWVLYSADLGDSIYIMLKDSLKKLPILNFGMINYKFIFLSRKWDKDREVIEKSLQNLELLQLSGTDSTYEDIKKPLPKDLFLDLIHSSKAKSSGPQIRWPYSLVLFPEGTVLSEDRRVVSDKFCAKIGRDKLKHVLLPRTTGLRHSLRCLRHSCSVVYDVTIGYSGVEPDEYGEERFTLSDMFLRGDAPEVTDMHWRAIPIDEIPLGKDEDEDDEKSLKEFEDWLFKIWDEKDALMAKYYKTGSFENETDETVTVDLKVKHFHEFLSVFAFPAAFILITRLIVKFVLKFWG